MLCRGLEAGDVANTVLINIRSREEDPGRIHKSPVSFLLACARNVIIADYRRNKRVFPANINLEQVIDPESTYEDSEDFIYERLVCLIKQLSPACQKLFKILEEVNNMTELANILNYKSPLGAAQQKKRCLDYLEKLLWEADPWLANQIVRKDKELKK